MNGTISVIIPVYNVELYLRQSLESVCKQTYKNLQIIIVDDGSTDSSGDICDEYASKDDRIRVIHQKNGGAANAKNTGLKVATGEFLAFLDSDDYLELNAYEIMIEQLNKQKADIIQCSFFYVFLDRIEKRSKFTEKNIFNSSSYLKLFVSDWTCGLLWDKLYRRSIFEGIYFEEDHKIDDEFFTYQGVMNASKIVRVPEFVYNYRQRKSGVMLSKSSQEVIIDDTLEYLSVRRKNITKKYPELKSFFDEHYLNMLLILSKKSSISENGILKIKQCLKMYNRENDKIKISFSLWKNLTKLKYYSVKKILTKREKEEIDIDRNSYFL